MSVGGQAEKPRFFIDLLQYQYEIGNVGVISEKTIPEIHPHVLGFNPTRSYESEILQEGETQSFRVGFKNSISLPSTKMFVAVLGHKFASKQHRFSLAFEYNPTDSSNAWSTITEGSTQPNSFSIVNGGSSFQHSPEYDGWTICEVPSPIVTENIGQILIDIGNMTIGDTYKIGGLAFGMIYEPEFHADLAVTHSRIMDGVKNKQTKGGKTYSVINYTKPPNWWTGSPFELTDPDNITSPVAFNNARIGRRSWDVGFSQLSDRFYTDGVPNGVFPANDMVNKYLTDTVNGSYSSDQDYDSETNSFNYNINDDNSLYGTVYHHTLGGTLPFLFSPSPDNSPNNFAICRFDKPGFKVTQKSYKKFNIKMKINESW